MDKEGFNYLISRIRVNQGLDIRNAAILLDLEPQLLTKLESGEVLPRNISGSNEILNKISEVYKIDYGVLCNSVVYQYNDFIYKCIDSDDSINLYKVATRNVWVMNKIMHILKLGKSQLSDIV